MDKLIKEPTSVQDLFNIAGKKCNVYEYKDLKHFDDIDEIFEDRLYDDDYDSDDSYDFDDNSAIILYKSEPMFGHWTMIRRNDDGYNYLDSYGEKIDNPLDYVPKNVNKELGQEKKYLAKLLLKAMNGGSDIYYNNAKLQKVDPDVATCGRYCAMYLKFSNMNVDDFAKMIKKLSKKLGLSNDELITYMSMVNLNPE